MQFQIQFTSYVRSLTAMTTTDINLSVEQVCSTERARRRSRKFKERATWHIRGSSNIFSYSFLAIPWQLTHLLLSLDYFKNTGTNTKFSNIVSLELAGSVLLFDCFTFFLDYWTSIYIHKQDRNTNTQGSSMRHKRGESIKFSNYETTVSMESPFEILEQPDDHAHADETSREKLVLSKQTQNLGPLLRRALGD